MRDLRLTYIGGGADEVMLGIISKHLGLGAQHQTGISRTTAYFI